MTRDHHKNNDQKFRYVVSPFHKDEITGLDVCVRKDLIVTCSKDKTVRIWNYNTRKHEVSQGFAEECLAVAFHPSGLHIIVAFPDKMLMCNVLTSKIVNFKPL